MSGTKLPVRGSADPDSPCFIKLTEAPMFTFNGLRYTFPIRTYDMELGFVTFYNTSTGQAETFVGNIKVFLASELWDNEK